MALAAECVEPKRVPKCPSSDQPLGVQRTARRPMFDPLTNKSARPIPTPLPAVEPGTDASKGAAYPLTVDELYVGPPKIGTFAALACGALTARPTEVETITIVTGPLRLKVLSSQCRGPVSQRLHDCNSTRGRRSSLSRQDEGSLKLCGSSDLARTASSSISSDRRGGRVGHVLVI